jgi:hypothetical protein
MDQEEALGRLIYFRRMWAEAPKNRVLCFDEVKPGGKNLLGIFFDAYHYQILVMIHIGSRFGLSETCYVVDTRKKSSESDQMVVAVTTSMRESFGPSLFHLSPEVVEAKTRRDLVALKILMIPWIMHEQEVLSGSLAELEDRVSTLKDWSNLGVSVGQVRYSMLRT